MMSAIMSSTRRLKSVTSSLAAKARIAHGDVICLLQPFLLLPRRWTRAVARAIWALRSSLRATGAGIANTRFWIFLQVFFQKKYSKRQACSRHRVHFAESVRRAC
ncbi:hypothetical protein LENED_008194 [Lentinula edodes]|uniref:Uncharacterized protein n=1 Tax=Lentinula edodes TaxID=5353 RepID=A0A1Q3EGF6_LENED|nr:hypothetical protein LENED_008194 [Lentinula edodes]